MGSGRCWRGSWGFASPVPQQVSDFAEIAKRYCAAIEGANDVPVSIAALRALLAEIYLRALSLPVLDCGDVIDPTPISHELEKLVSDRLQTLPIKEYWEVFDPLNADDHVADLRPIANDLFEIWRDLRDGLTLLQAGNFLEATWDWKNGFSTHWGNHLLCAQRAIHSREEGY